MSRAKQSKADRERRLDDCRCPVHGGGMGQASRAGTQFVVECPRSDCDIRGTTATTGGPVVLLPEFQHLLT